VESRVEIDVLLGDVDPLRLFLLLRLVLALWLWRRPHRHRLNAGDDVPPDPLGAKRLEVDDLLLHRRELLRPVGLAQELEALGVAVVEDVQLSALVHHGQEGLRRLVLDRLRLAAQLLAKRLVQLRRSTARHRRVDQRIGQVVVREPDLVERTDCWLAGLEVDRLGVLPLERFQRARFVLQALLEICFRVRKLAPAQPHRRVFAVIRFGVRVVGARHRI